MLATVLAPFAFRGILGDRPLHVFLRFCEMITNLLERRVVLSELAKLQLGVVECLCLLELHYPETELTICFHLLLHATEALRWGPFCGFWMFPFERFLGFLTRSIKNRAYPEANMVRLYRHFVTTHHHRRDIEQFLLQSESGAAYQRLVHKSHKISAGAEVMQPRYKQLQPVLLGPSKPRMLSEPDWQQLLLTLRRDVPELHRVWREYEEATAEVKGLKPERMLWEPADRLLTIAERQNLLGPSHAVTVHRSAIVGGVEFRAAEGEAKKAARSSYFVMDAVDEKGVVHHNYGRFLYFCAVELGAERLLMARVTLYKGLEAEVVCPALHEIEYELPRIDTSSVLKNRSFVQMRYIRGKVALGPPDARLSLPSAQRLVGPCYVLSCANCVL